MDAWRDLCLFLNCAVIMGPTSAAPDAAPSTQAPNVPGNIRADNFGASPNDQAAWLQSWHAAGMNIIGHEFANEPGNNADSHNPEGAAPWYGTFNNPNGQQQSNINKALTWAEVHLRQYATAIRNTGIAGVKINAMAFGGGQPYIWGWMKDFMSAICIDGSTWPYNESTDPQWNHWDVLTYHPYTNGSTNQGRLNSIFYDPGDTPGANASTGPYWMGRMFSEYVTAQGHPEKRIAWNESGISDPADAFAGLVDVGQAIYAFGWQAAHKLDYFAQWSCNCNQSASDTGEWGIMKGSFGGYTLYTRACILRDFVFFFSRNAKKIVGYGQAGGLTPSSGEHYGNNNSVPRLPWVAGLSADGKTLYILVCNLDLTNDEVLTITLPSVPTGQITGKFATQSTAVTGSTSCPSITPIAGTQQFSQTIHAGEMYLFEVPVSQNAPTFPSTPIVDNFDRANGDPGVTWVLIEGDTSKPQISGNQLVGA